MQQNQQVQDAIIRNIEIIGEAANHIQRMSPVFVADHPAVPALETGGMRNKVIHNYFDVDPGIIWRTVKEDFPRLKQQIDGLLSERRRSSRE